MLEFGLRHESISGGQPVKIMRIEDKKITIFKYDLLDVRGLHDWSDLVNGLKLYNHIYCQGGNKIDNPKEESTWAALLATYEYFLNKGNDKEANKQFYAQFRKSLTP